MSDHIPAYVSHTIVRITCPHCGKFTDWCAACAYEENRVACISCGEIITVQQVVNMPSFKDNKRELETRFTWHTPRDDDPQFYEEFRRRVKEVVEYAVEHTNESREQSLGVTHAEEFVMWINAARARRGGTGH